MHKILSCVVIFTLLTVTTSCDGNNTSSNSGTSGPATEDGQNSDDANNPENEDGNDNNGNNTENGDNSGENSDTTPPLDVTGLLTKALHQKIILSWTEPPDTDFAGVEITYTPGGETALELPKGTVKQEITNLDNNTLYEFTIKTIDDSPAKRYKTTTFTQINLL